MVSTISPRRRRAAALVLVAAAAAPVSCAPLSPALAQETSGGLSTTVPTLRGSVDPSGAEAPVPPAGPSGIGSAVTSDPAGANAAAEDAGKTKFAFPKGTAKTRDRLKPPRKGPPPLPPLQAYPTGARLRGGGAVVDTLDSQTIPGPTVAALPVVARLRTKVEDSAYDPLGVDVGSLRLTPYVAQSFGYDSNPDQDQQLIRPSAYSRTEGGLGILSNWSRNELRADMRGGYNDYFSDPQANRPDATGTIDYRFDATRDATLDAEARFAIDTQRTGSPEVSGAAVDRPLITTFGGSFGGTETLGATSFSLHGSVDRTAYDNAPLSGGGIDDLANENFTTYGVRGRALYEVTSAFRPYVDVLIDRRVHDNTIDLAGFARDSDGVTGQVGAIFEFNRLFTGDFGIGYGNRSFQDARLRDISGPVFNGTLAYAVSPLTVISLRGLTSFDETTVPGASGAQSRSATLEIDHQLLRNLTLSAAISYLNTQYVGVPITEETWAETLKAEYHLSRSVVATATFNHEDLSSTSVGSSFSQNVFLVGVRLQR